MDESLLIIIRTMYTGARVLIDFRARGYYQQLPIMNIYELRCTSMLYMRSRALSVALIDIIKTPSGVDVFMTTSVCKVISLLLLDQNLTIQRVLPVLIY